MQKVLIGVLCVLALLLLSASLLARFVWNDLFWTKLLMGIFGGAALLTMILFFGKRSQKRR